MASDAQNRFVKALIDRIETDDRYASLREKAATLKTDQAELDGLLAERENLRTPEMRASVDLQTDLDTARRTYNKLYPKLQLIFENKSFIETFFLPLRKSSRTAEKSLAESLFDDSNPLDTDDTLFEVG